LIEGLNYKDIESEFRAGYDSPEWLQIIDVIVKDLIKGLKSAESALAAEDAREDAAPPVASRGSDDEESVEGALELSQMNAEFEEITALTERANLTIVELGGVASGVLDGVQLDTMSPKQVNAQMFKVASAFKGPAVRLEEDGKALEERITRLDARLRALVSELKSIKNDNAQELLNDMIEAFGEAAELDGVESQMEDLIGEMKFASTMSVAVRNALQPAIRGIRSVQTATSTFTSWKGLT
jgi:hypothetical protein